VLLDILMPKVDGYQVSDEMRRDHVLTALYKQEAAKFMEELRSGASSDAERGSSTPPASEDAGSSIGEICFGEICY
jgi:CheY-like chemotaxis protein